MVKHEDIIRKIALNEEIKKRINDRMYKEKHCHISGKVHFCSECKKSTWEKCLGIEDSKEKSFLFPKIISLKRRKRK